jgi:hypothetical protein
MALLARSSAASGNRSPSTFRFPVGDYVTDARSSSLVVLGAHQFGFDENDPIYRSVANMSWASVLLVEANPSIAWSLATKVRERNPLPRVPLTHINIVNEGVCQRAAGDGKKASSSPPPPPTLATLPFFFFRELPGLPYWQTQIGSFSKYTLEKHMKMLFRAGQQSGYNYTMAYIRGRVTQTQVRCSSLPSMLHRHAIRRVGALMIDTEGLDCLIVGAQQWGSSRWCSLRPSALVFEKMHCSKPALADATRALLDKSTCAETPYSSAYHLVAEKEENVMYALQFTRTSGT